MRLRIITAIHAIDNHGETGWLCHALSPELTVHFVRLKQTVKHPNIKTNS
jgi:hypothetical protein